MTVDIFSLFMTDTICCGLDSSHPRYAEQLKNSRGQQRENEKLG